jgi:peptide deformylase
MAVLTILEYPDPRLRKVAAPVVAFTPEIERLVRDMAETMYAAPGVGLAATQVDVHKRIIVMDVSEARDELRVFINPEILASGGEAEHEEGCLSVPGYYDKVTVNRGATLNLAPGDYFIRDLAVRASATVNMSAPASLTTADNLDVGANARLVVLGSTRSGSINVAQPGAVNVGDGAEIAGILTAPRANVFFGIGSRLRGAAYAMSITMNSGSSFAFHRDCDRYLDFNCDGAPDCAN